MMYDNAVDQVKGMKMASAAAELPFHLAKVTSLSNGRAYVQFYGESTPSSKLYPYLEGYKPKVNDDVLMLRQGSTYIIAGKVSKDNIENNYYLLKSAADLLYLTEAAADEKYALKTDTENIYILRRQANSWYFAIDNNGRLYGNNQNSSNVQFVSIGDASNPMKHVYTQGLTLTNGGDLLPTQANGSTIGDASHLFAGGYFTTLGDNSLSYSIQNLNARNVKCFGNVVPYQNNTINIGTSSSNQFNNVYAKQFYQNGTAISTSDKRKKKSIKDLAKQYIEFFKNLRPRTFKFKDGESDRIHTGFIAQEVEEAAGAAGIDNKNLAFLCIDKDGSYGLRYEELIAVQTAVIQDLLKRVEVLEIKVNGRSES